MSQRTITRGKRLRNRRARTSGGRYSGPHDQNMEDRVQSLETNVGEIRQRLTRIETTLGHVTTVESMAQLSSELRQAIEAQGTRAEGIRSDLITRIEGSRSDLTKHIEGVRSDLTKHIEGVRSELTKHIEGVRSELTINMQGVRADLTKWFVTIAVALTAVAFTAAKYTH